MPPVRRTLAQMLAIAMTAEQWLAKIRQSPYVQEGIKQAEDYANGRCNTR